MLEIDDHFVYVQDHVKAIPHTSDQHLPERLAHNLCALLFIQGILSLVFYDVDSKVNSFLIQSGSDDLSGKVDLLSRVLEESLTLAKCIVNENVPSLALHHGCYVRKLHLLKARCALIRFFGCRPGLLLDYHLPVGAFKQISIASD